LSNCTSTTAPITATMWPAVAALGCLVATVFLSASVLANLCPGKKEGLMTVSIFFSVCVFS